MYIFPCGLLQVAVGAFHTLLSTTSGAVYGFGSNKYGELGMQKQCKMLTSPTRVEGLRIGRSSRCACATSLFTSLTRCQMCFVAATGRYHALAAGEHTSFVGTKTGLHSAGNEWPGCVGACVVWCVVVSRFCKHGTPFNYPRQAARLADCSVATQTSSAAPPLHHAMDCKAWPCCRYGLKTKTKNVLITSMIFLACTHHFPSFDFNSLL